MRKLALYTISVVAMLLGVATPTMAQSYVDQILGMTKRFVVGVDFATLFDNTEYAGMHYVPRSETLFSARLTPKVGFEWGYSNTHRVMLGADLVQDFGHNSKFVSDVNVQLYYHLDAPRVNVYAGVFPRSEMWGLGSSLFFDRGYRYYHNRMQGVLFRYKGDCYYWGLKKYFEFAMDYDGMRSYDVRESFKIMSAGEYFHVVSGGWLRYYYDFLMGHYAKDYNPETIDGVVDNLIVRPSVGWTLPISMGGGRLPSLVLSVDASYILSLQRDRVNENIWKPSMGGEIKVEAAWRGAIIRNRLYFGQNLFTHYNRYGADLYSGSPFYRTEKGLFNAIELGYKREFAILAVEAGVSIDYDGTGWGTRQFISLVVNFNHGFEFKKIIDN